LGVLRFEGTEGWAQGLVLARQVLYHLGHASNPLCSGKAHWAPCIYKLMHFSKFMKFMNLGVFLHIFFLPHSLSYPFGTPISHVSPLHLC
jgi:hypothetical protein